MSGCVSSERDTNGLPVFIVRYNSSSSSSSADAVENLFNVTVNLKNQADGINILIYKIQNFNVVVMCVNRSLNGIVITDHILYVE